MNTHIVPVRNPALKAFVQYFIFFGHNSVDRFTYQTFPNTNLCLAIYKENRIEYQGNKNNNLCTIRSGGKAFSSQLYGFHQEPFKVDIKAALDQVCILFAPGGLRAFTQESYEELVQQDRAFECVFGDRETILEQIFQAGTPCKRAELLETFLLSKLLADRADYRIRAALETIACKKGDVTIHELSRSLKINESTLFRSFKATLGQSPKYFIQTAKFRASLSLLLEPGRESLTRIAYASMFYDQSHFIKDFKKRAGVLPAALSNKIQLEQNQLAWLVQP